jgi:hypothetical protein
MCKWQLISREEEEKKLTKIKGWVKFLQLVSKLKTLHHVAQESSLKGEGRQVSLYPRRYFLLISGLLAP